MSKTMSGTVVSTAMAKTVVVRVENKFRHPLYQKVITKHKRFKAHNEIEGIQVGDVVTIGETRPLSKTKHFNVLGKVENK
ncbi:30S ribosomal protein S17 [Candidatus Roizmanbacteria bacterium CG_4_10_14_0_2_um_filter_36_9]|uniref:Small ribosomal subunit protein uS17 n=2 Tax=Candidatus Roizmaniibacteriota TaxID=1752723 RepID=A0A2M7U391_9BACT|nr:MAG: 30S ribosomal protein S17 [Candidatus Roizmanbacteria bacterium CG_4_10_14_0_2_um_filter_36_9]